MPLDISAAAIVEKNKLSSTGKWCVLVEVVLPSTTEITLCHNTEDINWPVDGVGADIPGVTKTYVAFPFELGDLNESSTGEVPLLDLRVSNRTKALLPYIDEENGARGSSVTIMVVHSEHLDNATPERSFTFRCKKSFFDKQWLHFHLSTMNRHTRTWPAGRIMATQCRYRDFGGDRCGFNTAHGSYDGNGCDRSKSRCLELFTQIGEASNHKRFGGAPGVGKSGFYD